MPVLNRWWIAVAGVCLQMALGAAYAWSVFRIPLSKEFGWSISQVTLTFTISWFFLGCSSVVGGLWMKRSWPEGCRDNGGRCCGAEECFSPAFLPTNYGGSILPTASLAGLGSAWATSFRSRSW